MSLDFLGGGGQSNQPPPPKVYPVNLGNTLQTGIAADQFGYNLSDADFAQRFPGLVSTRDENISTAYNELTGPLDPVVQNEMTTSGLAKSLSAFGAGSEVPDVTDQGSIGRNTIGASIAQDTSSYQDSARNYIESLSSDNPQRAFGPSGADLLSLAILNQGNQAQANQQAAGYASAVGASNAQAKQASTNAAINAGVSILSTIATVAR
jgi:hypothetical protein